MTIKRENDQIVITLPSSVDIIGLQRLIDYLSYKEATSESQATQDKVDELARELNTNWWENNKMQYLKK